MGPQIRAKMRSEMKAKVRPKMKLEMRAKVRPEIRPEKGHESFSRGLRKEDEGWKTNL